MKRKVILTLGLLLLSLSVAYTQSLSTETFSEANDNLPGVGSNFDVPIYVDGFPDVLQIIEVILEYDHTVLSYTGITNLQHPSFPAPSVVFPIPGTIKITYQNFPQNFSVLPASKLFDLQFDYLGGNTQLVFGSNSRFRSGVIIYITEFNHGEVLGGFITNSITDGIWDTPEDWSLGVVPNLFHNVFVVGTATINADAFCNDLRIETTGRLTVGNSSSLTVNGNIVIDSDITGTGSFVNHGSFVQGGDAKVKQYLTGGNWTPPAFGNWHLIGVPVNSVVAGDVFMHCVLDRWNESTGLYQAVDPLEILGGSMEGLAVAYHGSGNTTLVFEGQLNDGNYSIPVTSSGATGDNNRDRWNLIGNPFPSALDYDGPGWTFPAGFVEGIAYWDESFGNYRYYKRFSLNNGSRFIPPMQGFFIETISSGNIGVTNATRAHTTQNFYKADPDNMLRLLVQAGTHSDETIIRFVDGSEIGFDAQYDYRKLYSNLVPQIYSVLSSQDNVAINALPAIDENTPVQLGFKANMNGMMTITANGLESFENSLPIWLYDAVADIHWNLRENPVYNFVANTDDDENRFSIHFKSFTGVPGLDQPQINIYAFNRQLFVDAGSGNLGEIVVVNILGQELVRSRMTENLNVISLPVSNSYVVVKVISDQGMTTRKVYVN